MLLTESGAVSWGSQHDVTEAVHTQSPSRELSEQAFDCLCW